MMEGVYLLWAPERRQAMAGKTDYKNQWQKENVDRVNLTMPKGKKDIIRAHAKEQGESLNSFINRAIDEAMDRDAPSK